MEPIYSKYGTEVVLNNNELTIKSRITLECDTIEKIIEEYTNGLCPVCFSDQFSDGDVICDRCHNGASEEREKYR